MRGLYIIVEGPTEEEFVNNSLYDYMVSKGITDVRAIKIETSPGFKGGDIKYTRYKPNVINILKREQDIIVSSLIDFFRLKNDFPRYEESMGINNPIDRVSFIEKAIEEDIVDNRFIPYIQLHEFEGLLFSEKKGFDLFPHISETNRRELNQIIEKYSNPELINDGPTTSPSKRLMRLIPGYQKTFHGPLIALENGFDSIITKCPRFNTWVETLIQRMRK